MCCLGMMSTCVGALGLMSSKTYTLSSSYTFFEGILPAMILQKRQFSFMTMMLADEWPFCPAIIVTGLGCGPATVSKSRSKTNVSYCHFQRNGKPRGGL